MSWPSPISSDPPRLAVPNAIVVVAVALTGGTLGLELMRKVSLTSGFLDTGLQCFFAAACTAALSAFLAVVAMRAKTVGGGVAMCALAIPLGVVNTLICLCGTFALGNSFTVDMLLFCIYMGALYGVLIGGPMGALLGLVYAWPIVSLVRARVTPAHDAGDRVLCSAGAWTLLAGIAATALAATRDAVDGSSFAACGLLVLGAMTGGFGVLGRIVRASWLRRVAMGTVPGWRVVPVGEYRLDARGAMPFTRDAEVQYDAFLVRDEQGPALPYRGTTDGRARALVRVGAPIFE